MGSMRFISPAETEKHKTKNETHGYHSLRLGRPSIHADDETVNVNWYFEVLKWLITVHIPCKRYYHNGQRKLYHDNKHLNIVQCVWDFLISYGVEVISHSPYRPDLTLCDFFLFPKEFKRN